MQDYSITNEVHNLCDDAEEEAAVRSDDVCRNGDYAVAAVVGAAGICV